MGRWRVLSTVLALVLLGSFSCERAAFAPEAVPTETAREALTGDREPDECPWSTERALFTRL